jgi:peptidoglycan/LPS O-acetylase OafA/YrhL
VTQAAVPQKRTLFSLLSRVTSSGRFIPEIDGLRFLAIGSVVVYHINKDLATHLAATSGPAPDAAFRLSELGQYGVPLFFAISGFILGMPFASQYLAAGRPVRLGAYFLRRLTRLEPPYILNLLLFFALKVFIAGQATAGGLLPNLLASMVYLHNQIFASPSLVNTVAWSLEVEVQFYVMAPLLALVFRIPRPAVRRSVILAAMLLMGLIPALGRVPERYFLSLLFFLPYFAVGFLLADLYVTDWAGAPRRSGRFDALALIAFPLLVAAAATGRYRGLLMPVAMIVFYTCVFRGRVTSALFRLKPLTVIGGMCYTIYLYHTAVIKALGPKAFAWQVSGSYAATLGLQVILIGIPVLLVSIALFLLIERPCMFPDWPQRLRARLTGRHSTLHTVRS